MHLQEWLRTAGLSDEQYLHFNQQVQRFREQLEGSFAPLDIERILAALELMVELHCDQAPRPDGTPYIMHPLRVASQVLEAMAHKDVEVVMAALLHDTVEDQSAKLVRKVTGQHEREHTNTDEPALEALEAYTQSARARGMVASLTNPDFTAMLARRGISKPADTTSDAASDYRAARNELYVEHVRTVLQDPDVALIKICDLAANALALDRVPDETRRARYHAKYMPAIKLVIERLEDTTQPLNVTPEKRAEMLARFISANNTAAPDDANAPDS